MRKTFGSCTINANKFSLPIEEKGFKTDPDIQEEIKRKDLEDKIKREKEFNDQYNKGMRQG